MRTLLLASAAMMFTAGAALAQTTTTAPAPQGPATAPVETQGSAAPGKTAPDNSTPSNGTAIPPSSVTSPSPTTGANPGPTAPDNTVQSTPPAQSSPSPMAPSNPPADSSNQASTMAPKHHWKHSGESMPANADASTYLHMAKQAIAHKDKARADDALAHAETRLLSRAVPQTEADQTDDAPAIKSIEHARAALNSGDMDTAKSDTDMAMHQMHHHMGPMASNGMAQ